ncbi:18648_t:CDS:10 [Funneliformis geosporum]|uniref:18648_t:CDS:1 n=1 Tax=Funneliformis geosporum TaxID=1117311 RepID=A0A9W4SI12_9GLOM|nr:18648_t:CDS:10 [Funneliformis geosporum]
MSEKTEVNSDNSEKDVEKKDLITEDDSIIPMAVNTNDDPSLPCLTFRFWVLSTFFTTLGAGISTFYLYRPNGQIYSVFFVLLASFFMGQMMSKVLPTRTFRIWRWEFSLNPGPFNVKEHVCIVVAASTGGTSAYAIEIISIQELFYNTHIPFLKGFFLILSTQVLGFGMAGFLRKYLVRPANMIWPVNLVYSNMYNTLHDSLPEARKKLRYFAIGFVIVFIWQFVPVYMFNMLTSIALLCLIAPFNKTMNRLGSGYYGSGILNFTLDWNAIGQFGPLYTPWHTGSLDVTAYENYSPVYLSTSFAFTYLYSFMMLTATISHVYLFYGDEIWRRFKASRKEEESDVHCKLMDKYPEVPNSWYMTIFVAMLAIAIALGYITEAHLPWWALLLAVAIAVIMVLPIGVLTAISSNTNLGLNVITEMICGYMLPGYPIANVYFKTYGYMALYQCLLLVSDLKLGHYMKIPPRYMFISQIYATVIGGLVNYWVCQLIIQTKRPFLDGTEDDPTGQWAANGSQVFNTASIVWGLIGPEKTFGPGSFYQPLLWGFLIGFILPIPIYLLHRKYPKVGFNLVNIPLLCTGLSIIPEYYRNFIIVGFLTSFASQFYAYRYKNKYNYALSAALDSAAQISTMVIFFCLNGVAQVPFPEWWGSNAETQGERCFVSKEI